MRWVGLVPGQKWITSAQETIEIIGHGVGEDCELIFEVDAPDGRKRHETLITPYEHMAEFLERNEGALLT